MTRSTPQEHMTFAYPQWYTETEAAAIRREAQAEDNQRHVREKLAQREPDLARALDAAVHERQDSRRQQRGGRTR